MSLTVTPFLMFEGQASDALDCYTALFPEASVEAVERYEPDGPGAEGTILTARFTLAGQAVMMIDSPVGHAFGPTPAFSFFVECDSAGEVDRLAAELGRDGQTLMPPGSYPFSPHYIWLTDRFGVSWQIAQRP